MTLLADHNLEGQAILLWGTLRRTPQYEERMKLDEELERLVLAYSRRFQALLQEARDQIRAGSGIAHDDFWREVEADAMHETPAHDNAA